MKSIRHFCTLLVAALLFTFGTSCGQREQPTWGVGEVGAGAQPLAQKAVDPDHATAEVIVAWKGVPYDRSSPTALPQLFEIYKRACTGNPSVRCGGQNVQWETLRSAAQTHYGSIDPRYLRFRDTGQDFGVDH